MSEASVTTDRRTIQKWTEDRDGWPARVKGTNRGGKSGILRIDYEGYAGEDTLERITWEEFFDGFEKSNLAFLYQEKLTNGRKSRFSKLIDRDSPEAKGH